MLSFIIDSPDFAVTAAVDKANRSANLKNKLLEDNLVEDLLLLQPDICTQSLYFKFSVTF